MAASLRMALAPDDVRRLQDEIALVKRLGIEGIDWPYACESDGDPASS